MTNTVGTPTVMEIRPYLPMAIGKVSGIPTGGRTSTGCKVRTSYLRLIKGLLAPLPRRGPSFRNGLGFQLLYNGYIRRRQVVSVQVIHRYPLGVRMLFEQQFAA